MKGRIEQRRDMHPLPESLAAIDGLRGLKYVKGKDKVLLVRSSTGSVGAFVDGICHRRGHNVIVTCDPIGDRNGSPISTNK
jgi:hypothetical protein